MSKLDEKWISLKDRLPTGKWSGYFSYLSEEVLIAGHSYIRIGFYSRRARRWFAGIPLANRDFIDKPTHWMPLPINPHKGD